MRHQPIEADPFAIRVVKENAGHQYVTSEEEWRTLKEYGRELRKLLTGVRIVGYTHDTAVHEVKERASASDRVKLTKELKRVETACFRWEKKHATPWDQGKYCAPVQWTPEERKKLRGLAGAGLTSNGRKKVLHDFHIPR